MKLAQNFTVKAEPDVVWDALIDIERVAPCLPGADLTDVVDGTTYRGTFTANIGPTRTHMIGELKLSMVDADAQTATLSARGADKSGQSTVRADIAFSLTAVDGGTEVHVLSDYTIAGRLARLGRGGLIEGVANKILAEFSTRLHDLLAATAASSIPDASSEPASEPGRNIDVVGASGRRAARTHRNSISILAVLKSLLWDRIRGIRSR